MSSLTCALFALLFQGTLQLSHNDCFLYCVPFIIIMIIIILRLSQEDEKADVKIRLCIFPEDFWAFGGLFSPRNETGEFFLFMKTFIVANISYQAYNILDVLKVLLVLISSIQTDSFNCEPTLRTLRLSRNILFVTSQFVYL